jgi:hypothetical protein
VQVLVSCIQALLSSGFPARCLFSSVFCPTLYFKQPMHQLGEIFHDFLQRLANEVLETIDDNQGRKLFKSEQSAEPDLMAA